jgi:antitoxin (DNA-binding transcriptional repressor) of toxin-antitoxin stability system
MPVITVHKAKTSLSRLIKRAAEGEDIVIARGDKPGRPPCGSRRNQRQKAT